MSIKDKCPIIYLKEISDNKGKLVVIESEKNIPFKIMRVFYIYGTDKKIVRGKHANTNTEFVIINLSGKSKLRLYDGVEEMTVCLDSPMKGIYIPKMIWKDMYDFSKDSIMLVLASTYYDSNEYIKSIEEFDKYFHNNDVVG